jgi:hypothetical protein
MSAHCVRYFFAAVCVAALAVAASSARAALVINEIDANQTGSVDSFEFVELAGPANLALDGYTVVFFNGATDASYRSFDLDGFQLGPTGYFLLGNAGVVPPADIVFPDITLQNGADAVALYLGSATDFPNGTPVTSTNLVDAIVYGSSANPIDAGLLTGLNQTTQYIDTDTTSISRVPEGMAGSFTENTVPTPMNSGVPQVPEPGTVAMVGVLAVMVGVKRWR